MSKALFRAIIAASITTVVVLMYFVAGERIMSPDVFDTLRIVAATLWIVAIAIRCTEVILARIDASDETAADRARLAANASEQQREAAVAEATLARLGGSRTRTNTGLGVLTPVE
ncbi:MAG TPA: hypothetical protein VM677_03680 [Actinokineospora sp.]|jgi:hypothetical protein|nr:hypothetical protein [Actinokineospora sp.]